MIRFRRTCGPKPGTDSWMVKWTNDKNCITPRKSRDQDQEFTFNELGVQRFVLKRLSQENSLFFFPFFASVLPIFLRTCLQHSNFIHHDIVGESLEEYQTSAARIASKRAYSSATTAGAWKNLGPWEGQGAFRQNAGTYCTDSNSHF